MANGLTELQVDNLIAKIKHYLITMMGRTADEADDQEFYRAFSYALREEIMINWAATAKTYVARKSRMLYYLSMEYLPGKYLGSNITNICVQEIVVRVLKAMKRTTVGLLACEPDPGLGNGGLGRLASCFLDSLATQRYPAIGYGLRYQYGIFEQEVWDGIQVERPDCWLLYEIPWDYRRDLRAFSVKFSGRTLGSNNPSGEEVLDLLDYEEVRAIGFDTPIIGFSEKHDFAVNTLRLWTTKESPRNFQLQRFNAGQLDQAAENTTLTDVLYPNDNNDMGKRIRLKQEFLLVSASIQDIIRRHLLTFGNIGSFEDVVRIQINDTHPALVIVELMRLLTKEHNLTWNRAWEVTKACVSYTNHTVLAEALEQWNENRLRTLLPRQYQIIERLNMEFCTVVRSQFPADEERVRRMSIIENGQVRMANLAIYGSHHINGVAALHTEILKTSIFKDFYEAYPQRFLNITNGVTQRRWLLHCNPLLAEFITKRIGKGWVTDFKQIRALESCAADKASQEEFLEIKLQNKKVVADFLQNRIKMRDYTGKLLQSALILDPLALFDVHVKRIHEYKRQLLNALHIIMLYNELLENPASTRVKRTVIFGGKAAPGYELARNIIRLINCISRKINNDPAVRDRLNVFYIPNYDVSKAEILIPGADLSQQISTAGMEASGTGVMKLAMNGAMTIGTEDGANIEMRQEIKDKWWPFSFGCLAKEIAEMKEKRSYSPWDICSQNPKISRAVEALRDRSFSQYDAEHDALLTLYHSLMNGNDGDMADRFFVLKDLEAYYNTQLKVEALFRKPHLWAEHAIHNIAGMGPFSADGAIENYAKEVWGLDKVSLDEAVLEKIREEYNEHDRCRILVAPWGVTSRENGVI